MTETIRSTIGQSEEMKKLKENLKRSNSQLAQAFLGLLRILFPAQK